MFVVLFGENGCDIDQFQAIGPFETHELAEAFESTIDTEAYNDAQFTILDLIDYKKAILEKTIQLVQED